ncbi:hypothetical protein QQZ08_000211 [Neonectria magnoliae]|uniref:Uncharacterized protein n=1 Tax=Neonectria magnoliae TaxID=2732573 RepID=A0ABR1IJ33_9HYPO
MFEKSARVRGMESFVSILQALFATYGTGGIADAIEEHPLLIYIYLHFSFNDFNLILKSYEQLFKIAISMKGRTTWGVSDRSFLLNSALIQISFSLPDILQHRAVLKRLKEYNNRKVSMTYTTYEDFEDVKRQTEECLLSMEDDVDDFERQVDMFLERFKASLELVGIFKLPKRTHELKDPQEFNVSDERMSWVMMWFTFVAILFTPIAFVASVFGITTVEADPKWFAAAATPVFLASVALCFYIFKKSQRLDEGLRPKQLQDLLYLMPYSELTRDQPDIRHGDLRHVANIPMTLIATTESQSLDCRRVQKAVAAVALMARGHRVLYDAGTVHPSITRLRRGQRRLFSSWTGAHTPVGNH